MKLTQEQKLAFADAIAESTLFLEMGEVVKIIAAASQCQFSWEEVFTKLRENDVIDNDNVPTEIALDAGLIGKRRTYVDDKDDGAYQVFSSIVTGKGLIHIMNLLINSNNENNEGEADNA